MAEEEIFDEFLSHIGDKNCDGVIAEREFLEYYVANSAGVDNDEHFCELERNGWKLD